MSHLSTLAEVHRVIALRPETVVMTKEPRDGPLNEETYAVVLTYVRSHCRLITQVEAPERLRSDHVQLWGDCRKAGPDA